MKALKLLLSILFCLTVFVGAGSFASAAPLSQTPVTILYVKPGANGTCATWGTACDLQIALGIANPGDQIWVVTGTYKPTTLPDRTITFQLKSGVAIFGGFNGTETNLNERDWETNTTTLSGDIGNISKTDNSYHVVTGSGVDATAVMDGFSITGGSGDNGGGNGSGMFNNYGSPTLTNMDFNNNIGGGMYNHGGSPTLTNVTFSSNSAENGGGMHNSNSHPTLTNVTFSSNTAGLGGGMYNNDNSNPTLISVTFSGNTASNGGGLYNETSSSTLTNVTFSSNSAHSGGGMTNSDSNPTLVEVTFAYNTAEYIGGGIDNSQGSPTLTNVTFQQNAAEMGGGMASFGGNPKLTNVTFSTNRATGANGTGGGMCNYGGSPNLTNVTFSKNYANGTNGIGGGMYNNYSSPTMVNLTFSDNYATNGGGIYNIYSSNPRLTNVTFKGNSADYGDGGGIYNWGSSPTLINTTFSANKARMGNHGGGLYNYSSSLPTLTNSILWDNYPDQIFNISNSSANVTYSDISGGDTGLGNFGENPLLGLLSDYGGFTQTMALNAGSPAIDAGNPYYCPATDERDYRRPIDGNSDGYPVCDVGAYEYGSYPAGFLLTINLTGSGNVSINPVKPEYLLGDEVVLTASTDATGWRFTGWSGGATGTDNPKTLIIQGNTSITANFSNQYIMTSVVEPVDSGTVTRDLNQATYTYGTQVVLTADPNPGWTFSDWSGDAISTENTITVTVEADTSVTANFTQNEYTLSVQVEPIDTGTVTRSLDQGIYHYGDEVTLTANYITGWKFTGWSGGATGTDNPKTVTIQGNTSITANFSDQYTLSTIIDPIDSGTVTRDSNQATYTYGTQVTMTANPNPGWIFSSWSGDVISTENPLTLTIETDSNVTAKFITRIYLPLIQR